MYTGCARRDLHEYGFRIAQQPKHATRAVPTVAYIRKGSDA